MKIGKVIDIFSAKKGQSGLPRPKVQELNLINGYGIKNDKFAGKELDKSVMVVGKYAYEKAEENGISLEYGSLGENILLDFNPHEYNIGTIFQIGDALIEITQACTVCNHLSIFDGDLPILIQDCRGLYCKILESGDILVNKSVKLVENLQEKIVS